MSYDDISPIDQLRFMVRFFDQCNETFNQRFTVLQLAALYRAYDKCGRAIYPDEWSEHQIQACLRKGLVPKWDDNGKPIFQDYD